MMIKVFGHKSPDTDSTGSAILWAWYLNTHTSHKASPYVLGKLNKETVFVLDKWKLSEPELLEAIDETDEVTIVDTNNPQELFNNISDTQVVKIIDHHRLAGGLSTKVPVDVTIRPLASTATVIYDLMEEHIDTMPENMIGLMLSCILSDTLAFRSPTTTPHDKDVVEKLAKKLELDIQKYADEMFAAKSDLSDFSDSRIVRLDSKKVTLGNKTIRVSVIETTTPEAILERKEGIVEAIGEIIKEEDDIDDVLFFIIDIFKEEATVFTYNKFTTDIVAASFGVAVDTDTEVLPGILSRKKQIIPNLKLPE
ncbi:MAG: manganese-dependent inorganic pyrophosphatase [Candidatus Pacebacteria bacterium]|nr:manganese-dependent inorganic pyrophosphatase [Candidatus Paceibacterota bacterium]